MLREQNLLASILIGMSIGCFKVEARKDYYLLSMFKGTCLPLREGSHCLVKDTSTWSSFSIITSNFAPFILHHISNPITFWSHILEMFIKSLWIVGLHSLIWYYFFYIELQFGKIKTTRRGRRESRTHQKSPEYLDHSKQYPNTCIHTHFSI